MNTPDSTNTLHPAHVNYLNPAVQLKEAGVDERGIAVVNYAIVRKTASNSGVQKLLNVSKATATRVLSSLSEYLEVTGTRGKGTYYTIKGLTIGSIHRPLSVVSVSELIEAGGLTSGVERWRNAGRQSSGSALPGEQVFRHRSGSRDDGCLAGRYCLTINIGVVLTNG